MSSVKRTRKLHEAKCKCSSCGVEERSIPGTPHRKCSNKIKDADIPSKSVNFGTWKVTG